MSLVRSAATVGGMTMISRVLGFIRDMLTAAVLGAGPIADAFFVAFRLPNMFRSIFAEGAFNSAFVPLFAKTLEGEGEAAARRFAEQALALLLAALLILTLAAEIAMPWLMRVLAPGFIEEADKFDAAVNFSRIMFPYLLLISLTALQAAILNSLGRFIAGAFAPITLNITLIVGIGLIAPFHANPGLILSWAVSAAGILQFLLLTVACHRAGIWLHLRLPRITPPMRRLVRLGIPGVISGGINQINLLVGTIIASLEASVVSWLYYADRVYQLPLGVVGIAIGVVLLPDLSRRLRAGDGQGAANSQNRAFEFAVLLTAPAAIALAAIPWPIIHVLFERGAFDAADTAATALALSAYAAGLPAFVLIKVFVPSFFAREDTVTPLKFAALSILVNIAGSIIMFSYIGFVGIAIATSLAGWVNASLLGITLWRRNQWRPDARLKKRVPLLLLSATLMGLALWQAKLALLPYFTATFEVGVTALAVLVSGGVLVYGLACQLTGAATLGEMRRSLGRR